MMIGFLNRYIPDDTQLLVRLLTWLCVIAALSLYVGLLFPYRGEEGVYTASSFEMLHNHNYLQTYFMGALYGRPPLYNWLILAVAKVIGYKHMLLAARFVTCTVTIASSAVLYGFAKSVTRETVFSLLAVLCFLSGDLLFRRSWIAYADPTFSFFVFSAMACLWVSYQRNQYGWLLLAVPLLTAAFLTKALTCYVFYAITVLVLMVWQRRWRYFFHPISLLAHITMLLFPILWMLWMHRDQHDHRLLGDLFSHYVQQPFLWSHYFRDVIEKPFVYILRFAPISLLAVYCLIKRKSQSLVGRDAQWVKPMVWVVILNIMPYWLAPNTNQIRYLLPLFPLISLLIAFVLMRSNKRVQQLSIVVLAVCVLLKLTVSPWGLPWFEHMNNRYSVLTQEILDKTQQYPLYATDSDGFIAMFDAARYPGAPVVQSVGQDNDYFKLGYLERHHDPILHTYQVGRRRVTIFCHGAACNTKW